MKVKTTFVADNAIAVLRLEYTVRVNTVEYTIERYLPNCRRIRQHFDDVVERRKLYTQRGQLFACANDRRISQCNETD